MRVLLIVFLCCLPFLGGCKSLGLDDQSLLGFELTSEDGKLGVSVDVGVITGPGGALAGLLNKVPWLEKLIPDEWLGEPDVAPEEGPVE